MDLYTLGAGLFSPFLPVSSGSATIFAPWHIGRIPLTEPDVPN